MSALEIFKYVFMGTFGIVFGGLTALVILYFLLTLIGFCGFSKPDKKD